MFSGVKKIMSGMFRQNQMRPTVTPQCEGVLSRSQYSRSREECRKLKEFGWTRKECFIGIVRPDKNNVSNQIKTVFTARGTKCYEAIVDEVFDEASK